MVRLILLLLSPLVIFSTCLAEAGPGLPAKEAAEGWLMLFDGTTTFGWTIQGRAAVKDGCLVLGGDQETLATTKASFGRVAIVFDAHVQSGDGVRLVLGSKDEMLPPASSKGLARCAFVLDMATQAAPIQFRVPAGAYLTLKDIRCLPLGLKPLFTGKDLAGWKELPGSRARFEAADGELHLKAGPGDLQSGEQWADFILQLDVKTRGPQMNAGVLLRGQPEQFGSGYEVQIRNQWQGDDRTRVVDYGTGGIHNRVPARLVAANDGEWSTMTIAAHGRHIAVWVNGYPVCEFTDTRVQGKTASQGAKLDPGPIAIHGDDRNLDVSFRNIKLAELPRTKP